jgi:hypothetical protein
MNNQFVDFERKNLNILHSLPHGVNSSKKSIVIGAVNSVLQLFQK